MSISPSERRAAASAVGLNEQFLYQCIKGRRSLDPKLAVRVERASGGRIRRWDVRPNDWHEVWPDLIGAPGAPAVPGGQAEVQHAAA